MLLEQRMSWLDLETVCLEADIVSVGSESCINPFLYISERWSAFLKLIDLGLRVKVVLPRVAQNELQDTLNLLQKVLALQRNIEVVLNDWGLIYFCAHNDYSVKIHIGRQLCRSILDCPWHKDILKNETVEVKEIIGSHPFDDGERLEILRKLNVYGLEINSVLSKATFDSLLKTKMEVAIDSGEYLLTCGRTCLSKKIMKEESCKKKCDKKIDIIPYTKWTSYFEQKNSFSEYEKSLLRGMAIKGKKVILPHRISAEALISCKVDVIITNQYKKIKYFRRIIS